jgi:hypothetical protein
MRDDLTTLTLRIKEDSAKQLVNSNLVLKLIRLVQLGDGNVFDVSPAHSEMLILTKEYLLRRKLQ